MRQWLAVALLLCVLSGCATTGPTQPDAGQLATNSLLATREALLQVPTTIDALYSAHKVDDAGYNKAVDAYNTAVAAFRVADDALQVALKAADSDPKAWSTYTTAAQRLAAAYGDLQALIKEVK